MEQSTFRSRSFRRVLFASCCAFLFLITLRSINIQQQFQQRVAQGYQYLSKDTSGWLSRPRHVEAVQAAFRHDGSDSQSKSQSSRQPLSAEDRIKGLPEVIRIPFEEAVRDVSLKGWEDQWFSSATFDSDLHGLLEEPKIDFVYNCE